MQARTACDRDLLGGYKQTGICKVQRLCDVTAQAFHMQDGLDAFCRAGGCWHPICGSPVLIRPPFAARLPSHPASSPLPLLGSQACTCLAPKELLVPSVQAVDSAWSNNTVKDCVSCCVHSSNADVWGTCSVVKDRLSVGSGSTPTCTRTARCASRCWEPGPATSRRCGRLNPRSSKYAVITNTSLTQLPPIPMTILLGPEQKTP